MSTRLAFVIATALVALPCSASTAAVTPTPTPAVSVVQCGHLLDTAAGKLLGPTTLVVDAGRIREIHPLMLGAAIAFLVYFALGG